jgi:hypothetical protein
MVDGLYGQLQWLATGLHANATSTRALQSSVYIRRQLVEKHIRIGLAQFDRAIEHVRVHAVQQAPMA